MKAKRNSVMRRIAEMDPTRFRQRTVKPEKGKGRKQRPRKKDFRDAYDRAA